ncbi:MAG TPA: hypothetical protein VJV78_13200 [Polyangiales bacterium]|nr:hypothetical protein [Polyangiales bacterium]
MLASAAAVAGSTPWWVRTVFRDGGAAGSVAIGRELDGSATSDGASCTRLGVATRIRIAACKC